MSVVRQILGLNPGGIVREESNRVCHSSTLRTIRHSCVHPFYRINEAFDLMHKGESIRSVVTF
jgi:Zn-dependent alcohol dehydrogenase